MNRAHLRAWEHIERRNRSTTLDEYELVFEDDVMRDRRVTATEVLPALSHTAQLSALRRLPFFYVDACAFQHQLTRGAFVIEFGPKLAIGGGGRSLHILRVAGTCTSGYGVRRGSIPFLRQLVSRCEVDCVAIDQILVRLSIVLGGAYVAGVGVTPPAGRTHPHVIHRSGTQGTGLFKQDRRHAGSVTTDKSWRNYSEAHGFDRHRLDCSRCVHNAILEALSRSVHSAVWEADGSLQRSYAFRPPSSALETTATSRKQTVRCKAWGLYNGQGRFMGRSWAVTSRAECPKVVELPW